MVSRHRGGCGTRGLGAGRREDCSGGDGIARAVIFGAGKVGRGFLAHLLDRADWTYHLIDADRPTIDALREEGGWSVVNLQTGSIDRLTPEGIHHASESDAIADTVSRSDLLLTSLGSKNLEPWARACRGLIADRLESGAIDLVLCENHAAPARAVHEALRPIDGGRFDRLGIVQAQVLRSCIEPTEGQRVSLGELTIQVQDHWTLPMDLDASRRPDHLYSIPGFEPKRSFAIELTRKLYTYNAINAAVCYIGAVARHRWLSDAACDEVISRVAEGVGGEASAALVSEHGFDADEQIDWCRRAMAKYRNPAIRDPIERNARDPIRKLGRFDRILGPIHLCIDHGHPWLHLEDVLMAALAYREPADPSAVRLASLIDERGETESLRKICPGIDERVLIRVEKRISERRP